MQSLATIAEPIPLETDRDGVVRVGGTRVTLDSVVYAFQEGLTAEEVLDEYPSLSLADIYAVIGYYLRHRAEVEAYMAWQQQKAEEVRLQDEARYDRQGIRERLLARRTARWAGRSS
jgi:uncharacterized protein (DUF433 family)